MGFVSCAKNLSMSPRVSVIIPVFNDSARLAQCLMALDTQSYPKPDYEVIVVDNGSSESVEPLVRGYSHARVFHEAPSIFISKQSSFPSPWRWGRGRWVGSSPRSMIGLRSV